MKIKKCERDVVAKNKEAIRGKKKYGLKELKNSVKSRFEGNKWG